MSENLPVPRRPTVLAPAGPRAEWPIDKPVYKATARVALDIGEEGLKALVPGGGILLKALRGILDLSDAADEAAFDEQTEQLLASVDGLATPAQLIFLRQDAILERLDERAPALDRPEIDAVARRTALAAYRNRIARDHLYADYRGIEGVTREGHAAALLLDQV